jgi:hypothetical protein
MDATPSSRSHHRTPWNKGKLVGQKAPFKPKDVWALRVKLQREHRSREARVAEPRRRQQAQSVLLAPK